MRTVPKLVAMFVIGGALLFPSQSAQACHGRKKCFLCCAKGCAGTNGYANSGYGYGAGSGYGYPSQGVGYGYPSQGVGYGYPNYGSAYSPTSYPYPSYYDYRYYGNQRSPTTLAGRGDEDEDEDEDDAEARSRSESRRVIYRTSAATRLELKKLDDKITELDQKADKKITDVESKINNRLDGIEKLLKEIHKDSTQAPATNAGQGAQPAQQGAVSTTHTPPPSPPLPKPNE